jgi:hypothetical protein
LYSDSRSQIITENGENKFVLSIFTKFKIN